MYRFKEEFRDATISIPSLRLTVNRFNVQEYGDLIMKKFPKYAHNLELVPNEATETPAPKRSRTRKPKD